MDRHNESLEEMRERHKRENTKFMKQLRRERRSMFVLLTAWAIYMCILPFTTSPEQILSMLSIVLIFGGQFIYVMGMD